ncbi:MAG: hypothetical protein QM607_13045 [Microbacterium sp.]
MTRIMQAQTQALEHVISHFEPPLDDADLTVAGDDLADHVVEISAGYEHEQMRLLLRNLIDNGADTDGTLRAIRAIHLPEHEETPDSREPIDARSRVQRTEHVGRVIRLRTIGRPSDALPLLNDLDPRATTVETMLDPAADGGSPPRRSGD